MTTARREDILKRILARKAEEITAAVELKSLAQQSQAMRLPLPPGFVDTLNAKVNAGQAGVIAEIKKASPTRCIREDFDPPVSPELRGRCAAALSYSPTSIFRAKVNTSRRCAPLFAVIRKDSFVSPNVLKPALWVRTAFCVAALGDAAMVELAGSPHLIWTCLLRFTMRTSLNPRPKPATGRHQ